MQRMTIPEEGLEGGERAPSEGASSHSQQASIEKKLAELQIKGSDIPQEESNASVPKPRPQKATCKEVAEEDESASGEELADAAGGEPCSPTAEESALKIGPAPKKKKKKARKSKSKRAVTGFEDNFAEAPLTTEEYQENQKLYDQSKPFSQRIETCIQRYKSKRKFDAFRNQIFENYLVLGGITAGQNKFSGGLDMKHNDDRDAEQIAAFTATDYVDNKFSNIGASADDKVEDEEDPEYVVDFDYVVRGFLSYKVPYVLYISAIPDLELCVKLVRNFLNYVLYHQVCDEFKDNIKQALASCDLADKELPLCQRVSAFLPGDFNKACSTLFGGHYELVHPYDWDNGEMMSNNMKKKLATVGYSKEEAEKVFLDGIIQTEHTEAITAGLKTSKVHKEPVSMRVVDVVMPPQGSRLNDLGCIHTVVWTPEGGTPQECIWGESRTLTFWLEKCVLQYCFEGMCLEAVVHQLESGLLYLDSVTGVMTSFYLEMKEEREVTFDSDDFE